MSDDKDLGFVADDEMGFVSDESTAEPKQYSKMESAGRGAVQGGTAGFADEMSGKMVQQFDENQAIWNKLGFGKPSPTQVDAQLKSQGFTGDLVTDPNQVYEQARDAERQENKLAQDQNPWSYGGGQVAGSAMTAMIPGGVGAKMMQPFGAAAQTANVGTKALQTAINSAPIGAAIGLGSSEADNLKDLAIDTGIGAGTSAAIGGITQGITSGTGVLADKAGKAFSSSFPVLSDEFARGMQGINTGGKKFIDATNQSIDEKLKQPISNLLKTTRDYKNAMNQKLINGVDEQIGKVTSGLNDEMNTIKNALVNSKESERRGLMKQINDHAVKTQTELGKVKGNVGGIYDKLENQIQDKGIVFNLKEEISQFGEDLVAGGVDPIEAQRLMKPFMQKFEKGDLTLAEMRDVKNKLTSLFNNSRGEIRKAAKQTYGKINDNQINALASQGDEDLAKSMLDANQRYKSILQLEEDFIGQIKPNPVTKSLEPSNEMLNTIKSYSTQKPMPKDLRTQDEFNKLANIADENFANQSLAQTKALSNKLQANENLNVAGPSLDDMQQTSQPLQNLLKQRQTLAEGNKNITNQFEKLTQPNITDKQIGDDVLNNFEQVLNPVKTSKVNDFETLLNEYKLKTGKDLGQTAKTLAEDARIIEGRDKGAMGMSFQSIGGIKSFGQTPANMAGRIGKNIGNVTDKIKKTTNDIFNSDLNVLATQLKSNPSKEAQMFAKQMEPALTSGSKESKNAVLFSLMQQPAFRKMMNVTEEKEK
jgi:hypothetical protein